MLAEDIIAPWQKCSHHADGYISAGLSAGLVPSQVTSNIAFS
jgi:hypothetical protein